MPAHGRAALLFAFSAPASGHAFFCFLYPRRLGRSNMGDYPLLWLGFRPVRCLLYGCDIIAMTPVDTACSRPSFLFPRPSFLVPPPLTPSVRTRGHHCSHGRAHGCNVAGGDPSPLALPARAGLALLAGNGHRVRGGSESHDGCLQATEPRHPHNLTPGRCPDSCPIGRWPGRTA